MTSNIQQFYKVPINRLAEFKTVVLSVKKENSTLQTYLSQSKIHGSIIDIQTPTTKGLSAKIWSDTAVRKISINGRHRGVLIDGKVYDNIHTNGIDLEDWKKILWRQVALTLTQLNFKNEFY